MVLCQYLHLLILDPFTGQAGTHPLVNVNNHGILIEDKLPTTMKNVNLNNKLELTRSTLFDEVTWGAATSGYITSYGNNKPKGWIAIEKEALAFMKVNSLHNVSVLLDNTGTSTQVNDDEHKYRNLNEDSDDTENVDEESYNEV